MHAARNICSTDSNWTHSGLPLHAWMQMVQTSHPSPFCIGMTELLGRVPRSLYSHSRVGQRSATSMTTSNPSAERKSNRQRGEVARRWLTAFIVFPMIEYVSLVPSVGRLSSARPRSQDGSAPPHPALPAPGFGTHSSHSTREHGFIVKTKVSCSHQVSFGMFKTWIHSVSE